ncbi:MAG: hypothetical protein J0L82_16510 [Deltaproteobacteria bacterium]|jgi:hypothetical protein|nr:hypothetical protein [Deltaproteobacteria bacterium]
MHQNSNKIYEYQRATRWLLALSFVGFLAGCKSGSSAFSDLIGSADGGTGNASIAITSFTPGATDYVVKADATQQFLVSAIGKGTLVYQWTLDDVEIGADLPSLTLNAASLAVGNKVLKVTIRDEVGTVSQTWNVKINGTPVVSTSTPTVTTVQLKRSTAQTYSVTMTDPNSDTLTYKWKLNGEENVLTSTTGTQVLTPETVGQQTISVDVYDGPASDPGTYKVTRTWTTVVNNFSEACNVMENSSQTNKACVYAGIAGIGDGLDPETAQSSYMIRPAALKTTPEGNIFVADDENNVVWFWNRYTSPSVTMLGVPVPVNTMKVVAGAGYPNSANSASDKALRNFLQNPHGLEWDGTHLYISDATNNRVVRVDSTGTMSNVNTAGCNSPRGLAKSGNQLYIACYSSHIIRVVNTDTLVGSTFAGTLASAGDPSVTTESTFTDATQGRLRGPYGLALDAAGDLFLSEYDGCRIRAYNIATPAGKQVFGASWTLSLNRQRIVLGTSGAAQCGTYTAGEAVGLSVATDARVRNLRLISFTPTGQLLISGDNMFRISALNFNSGSAMVLGTAVPGYSIAAVIGNGTSGSYLGDGQLATATRLANNYDAVIEPVSGNYFVADRDNRRLRRVNASNNRIALQAGNGNFRNVTNAGQGTVDAGSEKMNQPRGIVHDTLTGTVFVADSGNHRIRAISKFGEVTQAVGSGTAGGGSEENEAPSNTTMNQPRGLVLVGKTATYGGHLVWADSQNHRVRIWNRSSTQATLFGVTVDAGMVATVGGNGTSGTATTGAALQAAFNEPSGVTSDGTNLYVSDRGNHCVKRIDGTGTLSVVAGTCGTSANVNGAVGVGRMTNPEGLAYYSSGGHTGIVIAATGNTRVKFLRLSGPTTLLFGTAISVGDTNSVACGGTFNTEGVGASLIPCSGVYDVASLGAKFCFANSGFHNARCVDSAGATNTVLGSIQGIDDSVNLYFPVAPFSSVTYSAASPNYASQDGVTAFFLPSPLVDATSAPSLTQDLGGLMFPRSIYMADDKTVFVSDFIGLIRKAKLP